MGLFWEGDNLFCMGDGGFADLSRCRRRRDANGPAIALSFKTGGEHTATPCAAGRMAGSMYCAATMPTFRGNTPRCRPPPSGNRSQAVCCGSRRIFTGCEIVADGYPQRLWRSISTAPAICSRSTGTTTPRVASLERVRHAAITLSAADITDGRTRSERQTWRMPPYFLDVVGAGDDAGPRFAHRSCLLSPYAVPRQVSRGSVPMRLDVRTDLLRGPGSSRLQLRRPSRSVSASDRGQRLCADGRGCRPA